MRQVAIVFFPGNRHKTYDFWTDLPVRKGQQVVVATARGEATVEVVEVKDTSDRAEKFILRIAVKEVDY